MSKRVLIADDNERVRAVMRAILEKETGVEICASTRDGLETVNAAMVLKPDLLILDVLMPGLNGIEVATLIKKDLPAARTIVFTMYEEAIQTLAPAMGVNVVLTKREGISDLVRAVRSLLSDKFTRVELTLARAVQQKQLERSDLESLSEQLAVPLTRCSRDLKYLWVNRYYANWLQRPAEKIIGRSIFDVVGKQAFDSLHLRFDQVLNGEDVVYQAKVNYDQIGPQRISAAYKPTLSADGVPDGWVAFVEEISDTAETQAA
ncbi:MAG TPA: response regulator [Dongiaceae bacterium]|nr:response regulator [Dongiaceae bacterium]